MLRGADTKMVVQVLLDAYRQGAFPMADPETGEVNFYTTDVRGVFRLDDPDGIHVSRSLARRIRAGGFEVTSDADFTGVVDACARPRPREPDTWIDQCLKGWYAALHACGHAHSVEVWRADPETGQRALSGGIFGVTLGGAFFGESMFSIPRPRRADGSRDPLDGTDASKIALLALFQHLRNRGFTLFDTQFTNPHIESLGCVEMRHREYMRRLDEAAGLELFWRPFEWRPEDIRASACR